jgi:hypothetical protein
MHSYSIMPNILLDSCENINYTKPINYNFKDIINMKMVEGEAQSSVLLMPDDGRSLESLNIAPVTQQRIRYNVYNTDVFTNNPDMTKAVILGCVLGITGAIIQYILEQMYVYYWQEGQDFFEYQRSLNGASDEVMEQYFGLIPENSDSDSFDII